MASDVNELLDMLFDMIEEAKNVPLSADKCMVDRSEALDRIDEIRSAFPVELAEAQKLLKTRDAYMLSAKREGELILQQAEEKAKQMLAEDEILARAKQRSADLVKQAESMTRELKQAANAYCEDALRRTEEAVAEAHEEIKKSHARFRAVASSMTEGQQSAGKAYDIELDE